MALTASADLWRPAARRWTHAAAPGPAVTLAEAKAALRIDASDEDTLMTAFLGAAESHVERTCNRLLVGRAATLLLPDFPPRAGQAIELPGGWVQSVTAVTYLDTGGDAVTMPAADYALERSLGGPAALRLETGGMWPVVRPWGLPVTITYAAGWEDDGASPPDYGANVPDALKVAIQMMAGELYERREVSVVGAPVARAPAFDALLAPWRIHAVR